MSQFLTHDKKIYQETIGTTAMGTIVDIGRSKTFVLAVDGKCYLNWAAVDATFALTELQAAEYTTLEFVAPSTIVRVGGSWATDGYNVAGRKVVIQNAATAANNGTFTIVSATATDLTISEATLVNEAASTTERVNGYRYLEVATTDLLIPAAGTYTLKSSRTCGAVRIYNPHAVNSVLATIFTASNN